MIKLCHTNVGKEIKTHIVWYNKGCVAAESGLHVRDNVKSFF